MLFDLIIVIDVAPDYRSMLPETPLPAVPDALLLLMFVYFLLNEFGWKPRCFLSISDKLVVDIICYCCLLTFDLGYEVMALAPEIDSWCFIDVGPVVTAP